MATEIYSNEYAGFWIRVGASILDTVLLIAILVPIILLHFGTDVSHLEKADNPWGIFYNYILPGIIIIIFWRYKSATPGKILLNLKIADAETGGKPTNLQYILRYLGYFVASLPLGLGIFWVAFDRKKQGWHDKMAKTVVIQTDD